MAIIWKKQKPKPRIAKWFIHVWNKIPEVRFQNQAFWTLVWYIFHIVIIPIFKMVWNVLNKTFKIFLLWVCSHIFILFYLFFNSSSFVVVFPLPLIPLYPIPPSFNPFPHNLHTHIFTLKYYYYYQLENTIFSNSRKHKHNFTTST